MTGSPLVGTATRTAIDTRDGGTLRSMAELELRGSAPVIGGGPLDGARISTVGARVGSTFTVAAPPRPTTRHAEADDPLRSIIDATANYRLERAVYVGEDGDTVELVWRFISRRIGQRRP